MAEPECDHGEVDAGVEQSHRGAVAQDVRGDRLVGECGRLRAGDRGVFGEAVLERVAGQARSVAGREQRVGRIALAFGDPGVAVAEALVFLAQALGGQRGIFHLLEALSPDAGQPLLEWLGFGARNRLDDAQQGLRVSAIGLTELAVRRAEFQLHDFCVRFGKSLILCQFALEVTPVVTRDLGIGQEADHVNHAVEPLAIMPHAADVLCRLLIEDGGCAVVCHAMFAPLCSASASGRAHDRPSRSVTLWCLPGWDPRGPIARA